MAYMNQEKKAQIAIALKAVMPKETTKNPPVSYKPGMKISGESGLNFNALAFATPAEAEAYARDLYSRWTMTTGFEVVESQDPVNYRWTENGLETERILS